MRFRYQSHGCFGRLAWANASRASLTTIATTPTPSETTNPTPTASVTNSASFSFFFRTATAAGDSGSTGQVRHPAAARCGISSSPRAMITPAHTIRFTATPR